MWTYNQKTGDLSRNGTSFGVGYSGHGKGVNNPALEAEVRVGPIPKGKYRIGAVFPHHSHLGPMVMPLFPVGHDAHGRSGFFLHGDNSRLNHSGSEGCIIESRPIREAVAQSGDKELEVI